MTIAIDVSPLQSGHKVRGVGFYLENLKRALLKYYPENNYIFFSQGEKITQQVDLVHYPYFDPFFLTLPLFDKHKRIITVHDLTPIVFPKYFPAGIKGNFFWNIQKMNLRNSARLLTDSRSSQKDITKYTGIKSDKIDVVYLAASEEFKELTDKTVRIKKLKEKYHLPEKFVLYVGDVTWNKNLPVFIKAMQLTDIPLVMAGKALVEKDFDQTNPWNADRIKVEQMTSGNNKMIKLGFIPTDDLVTLYNAATVFVLPSLYEGFGLPILEAMQSGCPVITTKGGSLPEVAGEAAFYVNAYDSKEMAKGIMHVFENKHVRETLIKKGFENAKKFTWQQAARQTIDAYKKVLS